MTAFGTSIKMLCFSMTTGPLNQKRSRKPSTLLELQDWLKSNHKVSISVQRLSAVLLEMGCRRKKKPAHR